MIELKGVTKIYEMDGGGVVALRDVSFRVEEGELVVLKGVSGSGKSTILSLIAGITRPTEGDVVVDGSRVSKLPDSFASQYRRETIGFIFQRYNLIPNLSLEENILIPLIPTNPDPREVGLRLDRLLEQFNLVDKRGTVVKNLSGGEQQRVAIARALINGPKVVVADEPTANLDERLSLNFIDIVGQLKGEGRTVVIATHDPLFFNLDIVDRVIEVTGGAILDA